MTLRAVKSHPVFSADDYLGFERFSGDRHEFLDGNVYAMAGESPDHGTICFNLSGLIHSQLRGKPCRGYSPNMKVVTSDDGLFSYPDLMVVCGELVYFSKKSGVISNPTVIFEVLSRSTESYDRGEKFLRYTNYVGSLQDYVMISQKRPHVEHYSRPLGWSKAELNGLDAMLRLDSIECEILLADLYDRIEFTA